MLAIDQGERLAALAAQHCRPYPQVRVVPCAFEAWQGAAGRFDLFMPARLASSPSASATPSIAFCWTVWCTPAAAPSTT
jgi:hypothetical protein